MQITAPQIDIRTGSRLHFGLLELCETAPLCYGGLGLILEEPALELSITPANEKREGTKLDQGRSSFSVPQDSSDILRRMQTVEQSWRSRSRLNDELEIELRKHMPLHSGYGAGTQIACAAAFGLELYSRALRGEVPTPLCDGNWHRGLDLGVETQELVAASGRGQRSAIGLSGFLNGGILLDRGYACDSSGNSDAVRVVSTEREELPMNWRVLLGRPGNVASVSGAKESQYFQSLGNEENEQRERMLNLAEGVLQASRQARFGDFCTKLEEYMRLAGEMFADCQGGLYNGEAIAATVEAMQSAGLSAVGQSSWGPTTFAIVQDESAGQRAIEALEQLLPQHHWQLTRPSSTGAKFRIRTSN